MRRTIITLILALTAVVWLGAAGAGGGGQPPRLVVDNRTDSVAHVQVWAYNGAYWNWQDLMSLNPRSWRPVYDVHEGKRFRAFVRQSQPPQEHSVRLQYDTNYGGYQDLWWIR